MATAEATATDAQSRTTPLALGSTMRRALRIARAPSSLAWIAGHVVGGALVGILGAPSLTRGELIVVWPMLMALAVLVGSCHAGLSWMAWQASIGQPATAAECLTRVRASIGSMALASSVIGFLAIVGANCAYIGTLLVIADLGAVLPSLLEDGTRPTSDRIARGRALLDGHRGTSFNLYLLTGFAFPPVFLVALVPVLYVAGELCEMRGASLHEVELVAAAGLAVGLIGGGWGAVAAAIYTSLREQRDALDSEALAQVFS